MSLENLLRDSQVDEHAGNTKLEVEKNRPLPVSSESFICPICNLQFQDSPGLRCEN